MKNLLFNVLKMNFDARKPKAETAIITNAKKVLFTFFKALFNPPESVKSSVGTTLRVLLPLLD